MELQDSIAKYSTNYRNSLFIKMFKYWHTIWRHFNDSTYPAQG